MANTQRPGRLSKMAQTPVEGSEATRIQQAVADERDVQVRIVKSAPVAFEVSGSGEVYSGQTKTLKPTLAYDLVEQGIAEVSDADDSYEEAMNDADPSKLESPDPADPGKVEENLEKSKQQLAAEGEELGVKDASKQGKDGLAVDVARADAKSDKADAGADEGE
jgi:hypothetical protein